MALTVITFGASLFTGFGATYKDGLAVIICGGGGAGPYFFGLEEFFVDFLSKGFCVSLRFCGPIFVCLGLLGAAGAWNRRGVP